MKLQLNSKSFGLPFILVSFLFMLWGVANNMNDTLLAAFKRIMSMSDLQTSLVQFAFFGAYFCFALPAALFIRKFTYKTGILLGLALYATGTMLFLPAGESASYSLFLIAIYVMAGGCAILETTANPYILSMGARDTATRRLNIAQTLNPVGAICGILLSRHFILSELNAADAAERGSMPADLLLEMQHRELGAISGTYMIIGCTLCILFVVILLVRMPKDRDDSALAPFKTTIGNLWKNRRYRYGVVTQFFYVGVQTCVWSFTIRYVMAEIGCLENDASIYFLYSIIAFAGFRFFFTWLMKYIDPARLLLWAAVAGIALSTAVILFHGMAAVIALVAISAAMSLMFPTIYGVALGDVEPADAKIGASGLIMSILGGALITPIQALVSDVAGISVSFCIPLACFFIILLYSLYLVPQTSGHKN